MPWPPQTTEHSRRLVKLYSDAVAGHAGTVDGIRERFGYCSVDSLKVAVAKAKKHLANEQRNA